MIRTNNKISYFGLNHFFKCNFVKQPNISWIFHIMNCLIYNNLAQLTIFARVDIIYRCMYFLLSFKLRGFCIKFWPLLLNCIYQLWQCFVVGIFLFKKDSFLTLNELCRHKIERRPIVFNTGIKELKMGALHYSEKNH